MRRRCRAEPDTACG